MKHPQLSVSAVSSWRASLDEDIAMWSRLGVGHVGLSLRKCQQVGLDGAVRRVREARLRVSNLVECGWCDLADAGTWPTYQERLLTAIDAMAVLGVPVLVLTTGPAGPLDWDAAAGAFGEVLEPVIAAARDASIGVAIENTSPMRLDLSFVTTLRDTVDLAVHLGVSVCVELNSCWAERAFERTVVGAADLIAHVQCSDGRVAGFITPDRLVPGDGDIPLGARLRTLLLAGYRGAFEIEMVGPQIEEEGYERAIRRAVTRMDALLAADE